MIRTVFVKPVLAGTLMFVAGLAMAEAAGDPGTSVDGLKVKILTTASDIKSGGTEGSARSANASIGYSNFKFGSGASRTQTGSKADTAIGVTRINQAKVSSMDVDITATASNVLTSTNANTHVGVVQIGPQP
jgi:hypothetical protein